MGDVDERDPDLLLKGLELDLQCLSQLGIEGPQGLVEQEDGRIQHQRPRERHTLLLPTRELVRLALLEALEPHQGQRLADHRRHL
jgi:hypothetical protein